MRNKVRLYIEGIRADLDDGAFLLLNYTAEDLSNPTVVRNSFSKQITLKGTPQNDEIFGHIYRNDRLTQYGSPYTGPYFDPCRKTSFVIYNEAQEILESGYLKLDEIVTTRRKHEYKVTLYGGLGSFLYGLSYDAGGDKLTLADLDFGETLDFTIDRDTVSKACTRLDNGNALTKYDIVNFMPCYMGLPPSPFDANKAIVKAATAGLPTAQGEYTAKDGFALVTLPEKVTGNEAKDYRSYLQKPVIRMKAVIDAICDPANNGGWTVNQDPVFFDSGNPYWSKTWLTLPMLNDLNIDIDSASGDVNAWPSVVTIPGGGNLSKLYNLNLQLAFETVLDNALTPYTQFQMHCEDDWAAGMSPDDSPGFYLNYLEIQVVVKDSNDIAINTIVYRVSTMQAPEYMVQMDDVFDYIDGDFIKDGVAYHPTFNIQEYGAAKIEVTVTPKAMCWGHLRASSDPMQVFPLGTYDYNTAEGVTGFNKDYDNCILWYSAVASETVRTGASITQAALLESSKTPADYLLSYCKTFGIQIVVHKDEKVVDLIQRADLYSSTVVDINGRIDRGKGVTKKPFSFDARWYLFGNDVKGDFAEYYATKYSRPYGQFRVNTGYEFDADERRLTDGIVFGNLCEVMETSKYFCDLALAGAPMPSILLSGGKFTLYKSGESKDFDIDLPNTVVMTWNNPTNPMHDDWGKIQVHGAENAHLDERDTLVFFKGMAAPASGHVTLSDDTREMLALNGNNPCWMPGYCDYDAGWKVTKMPQFARYIMAGTAVSWSLDFGAPAEAMLPGVTFTTGSSVFEQYWKKYIADRYDDDSAVVTAYVDLRGFQVNENLLRQFYAFDGALWALNRIIDHSLTTSGCTKCEFVKVQDLTNYTTL